MFKIGEKVVITSNPIDDGAGEEAQIGVTAEVIECNRGGRFYPEWTHLLFANGKTWYVRTKNLTLASYDKKNVKRKRVDGEHSCDGCCYHSTDECHLPIGEKTNCTVWDAKGKIRYYIFIRKG